MCPQCVYVAELDLARDAVERNKGVVQFWWYNTRWTLETLADGRGGSTDAALCGHTVPSFHFPGGTWRCHETSVLPSGTVVFFVDHIVLMLVEDDVAV